MRTPAHVLALELGIFEEVLDKRGQSSNLSGIFEGFFSYMSRRKLVFKKLACEIVLSPPPSVAYVMNDVLYGAYPAATGVAVKTLMAREPEGVVLQPGFEGKGIYYYHTIEYRLFVLCEDNRKLIIYDIQATDRPGQVSEVSGMPTVSQCYSKKFDMAATDQHILILISTGHLFVIQRNSVRGGSCHALLVWSAGGVIGRCDHLLVSPVYPHKVKVLTIDRDTIHIVDVLLDDQSDSMRREPRYGSYPESKVHWGDLLEPLVSVIPISHHIYGVVTRRRTYMCSKVVCDLSLTNSSLRRSDYYSLAVAQDSKEVHHMQILEGFGDHLFVIRRDTSFGEQPRYEEKDVNLELKRVKSSDTIISDVCPDDPKRLAVYVGTWYSP
ncbi:hypothetical protein FOL47_009596 [Perkinsus chesapeaki]|uniref:Uncharacterized protein n=1 Tax=Perkinsus chesapeaki TaxID=330153 RepID=A0A7J6MSM2_PERCH|nr:hypothetical protein FOL47_009596 [Perkinsus chesapeaki]